jgi:bifunctional non-homologous end joining protein LigD
VIVRAGRRQVRVTNGGRLVFPAAGITKLDVVNHYRAVAPLMVPYLRGRPVMMQRVHESLDTGYFYQKAAPDYFPPWISRVTVGKRGGTVTHAVCDDAATLVYLANQNCITPHVWLSRADDLDRPDRLIFDMDPGPGGADDARFAAAIAREVLSSAGLVPYLMATGSRGFHVVVPLRRTERFETAREVARHLAEQMASRAPERLTLEARKEARHGRLFVDYLRNTYAQTAVPPFAIRARADAPVAVPLAWDELDSAQPDGWNVRTLGDRLARTPDPWHGMARHARSLAAARR